MIKTTKGRWYIKQGEQILGPFPNKLIGRYLILGRIDLNTPVSQDKQNWSEVSQYPALVPAVVSEAGTPEGDRALMLARIREDERSSRSEQPEGADERRDDEEEVMQLHRQIRDEVLLGGRVEPARRSVYLLILVVALVTIGGLYIVGQQDDSARLSDCQSAPQPGINWSGCNLEGSSLRNASLAGASLRNARLANADLSAAQLQLADLAYADLTRAILVSARLEGAKLKGASLNRANLQQADLTGADFSHAELLGSQLAGAVMDSAVFDHAIWVNGEKCLPGSVGACLLPVEAE